MTSKKAEATVLWKVVPNNQFHVWVDAHGVLWELRKGAGGDEGRLPGGKKNLAYEEVVS